MLYAGARDREVENIGAAIRAGEHFCEGLIRSGAPTVRRDHRRPGYILYEEGNPVREIRWAVDVEPRDLLGA